MLRPHRSSILTAALVTSLLASSVPATYADAPRSDYPGEPSTVVTRAGDGELTTVRYRGANRYDTAGLIVESNFPAAPKVFIARADLFPDALAGGYLAGQADAPILLSSGTRVPDRLITSLNSVGATDITILGGEAAISSEVEAELAKNYTVTRLAGDDRYKTAVALAKAGTRVALIGDERVAFLASGVSFPDALVAGPISNGGSVPLLLTRPTTLPVATRQALLDLEIDRVVVVGGLSVIGQSVIEQVEALGMSAERVSGQDRTATAVAMAYWAQDNLGWSFAHINVARGDSFPDALTLGPRAGLNSSPILLTRNSTNASHGLMAFLRSLGCQVRTIDIAGGAGAVSLDVEDEIRSAATGDDDACQLVIPQQRSTAAVGGNHITTADLTNQLGVEAKGQLVRFEVYRDTNGDDLFELVAAGYDRTGDNKDAAGASVSERPGEATFIHGGPDVPAHDVISTCLVATTSATCNTAGTAGRTGNRAPAAAVDESLTLRRDGPGECDASDSDLADCSDVLWTIDGDPSKNPVLTLTPSTRDETLDAGERVSHVLTATLVDDDGPVVGAAVRIEVVRDLDEDGFGDQAAANDRLTAANGSMTLEYSAPADQDATDVIAACVLAAGQDDCTVVSDEDDAPATGDNRVVDVDECEANDDVVDCAVATWTFVAQTPAASTLELSPQTSTTELDGSAQTHSVDAAVADQFGDPFGSGTVLFEVYRDQDADGAGDIVASGSRVVGASGVVSFGYEAPTGSASDVVIACYSAQSSCGVTTDGSGDVQAGDDTTVDRASGEGPGCDAFDDLVDCADQIWQLAPAIVTVTPDSATVPTLAGQQSTHTVTVAVKDTQGAALPGAQVRVEVFRDDDTDGFTDLLEVAFVTTGPVGTVEYTFDGPLNADATDTLIVCSASNSVTPCGYTDEAAVDTQAGDDTTVDRSACDAADDLADCADVTWELQANEDPPTVISLSPQAASAAVGQEAVEFTTTLTDAEGEPIGATDVRVEVWRDTTDDGTFELIDEHSLTTAGDGTVAISVVSPTAAADDVVVACLDDVSCGIEDGVSAGPGNEDETLDRVACDGSDDLFDCADLAWTERVPTSIDLTPEASVRGTSTSHPVVATVRDQFGEVFQGATVTIEAYRSTDGGVTYAETPSATSTGPSDAAGTAALLIDGPSASAVDSIHACVDVDSDGCVTVSGGAITVGTDLSDVASVTWEETVANQGFIGAAKRSLYPRPVDYAEEFSDAPNPVEWQTEDCIVLDQSAFTSFGANPTHVASTSSNWPSSPNCIYQGGFGIGPSNAIGDYDEQFGMWARAFAVRDAEGDTLIMVVIDATSYMADYGNKCTSTNTTGEVKTGTARRKCGAYGIADAIAATHGIDAEKILIASTHSHAAMDLIGGWGFVPDWYMAQVNDTVLATVDDAIAAMVPGTIEAGEELARPLNSDRRDLYFSPEEQQVGWFRALTVPAEGQAPEVIATIGAFAGHPTSFGNNTIDDKNVAHPDWVGLFEKRLEDRFGGLGMHFMTGLGNFGGLGRDNGVPLADRLPEVGSGTEVADFDVEGMRYEWYQPVTNSPLTALGMPGLFDREFLPVPAEISAGKSAEAPCTSSSDTSVLTSVIAARIGGVVITGGPGELFSNMTNTIKERSGALVALPLSQVNDGLGYVMQEWEHNREAGQGAGFAFDSYVGYEDAYAIDACFGDMVLQSTLALLVDGVDPPQALTPTGNTADDNDFGSWPQQSPTVLLRPDWWPVRAPAPSFEVGAAKTSIYPQPDVTKGEIWQTEGCFVFDESAFSNFPDPGHLVSPSSAWPSSPDCIYQGGFGIGPSNAVGAFDTEYGLWVRSLAFRDPAGKTYVLSIVDATSYLADYGKKKCEDANLGPVNCGARFISEQLADEYADDPAVVVDASSFRMASTHSHAAPDLIGGWGFVPDWYMTQVHQALKQTARDAIANLQPAYLEMGEEAARPFNGERRDTYWSAEEQQLSWVRAVADVDGQPTTIATLGAYAGHPTSFGNNTIDGVNVAHPDWVGLFERELEDRFGGIGIHAMTGLGNMSVRGGRDTAPPGLAALLPDPGHGTRVTGNTIATSSTGWPQPVTNAPLTALGVPGFFDRTFSPTPASISAGKSEDRPCQSAGAYSAAVDVSLARIGDFTITGGPGELFSNLTNTIREREQRRLGQAGYDNVVMGLAQMNDGLGYIMQEVEIGRESQQGAGFVAGGYATVDYEDSYAIDACFGDKVLQETLLLLGINPH